MVTAVCGHYCIDRRKSESALPQQPAQMRQLTDKEVKYNCKKKKAPLTFAHLPLAPL